MEISYQTLDEIMHFIYRSIREFQSQRIHDEEITIYIPERVMDFFTAYNRHSGHFAKQDMMTMFGVCVKKNYDATVVVAHEHSSMKNDAKKFVINK